MDIIESVNTKSRNDNEDDRGKGESLFKSLDKGKHGTYFKNLLRNGKIVINSNKNSKRNVNSVNSSSNNNSDSNGNSNNNNNRDSHSDSVSNNDSDSNSNSKPQRPLPQQRQRQSQPARSWPYVLLPKLQSTATTPYYRNLIIGIPTIPRPEKMYLFQTIDSLLANMSPEDSQNSTMVVFVADVRNETFVNFVTKEMASRYPEQIKSQLLDLVLAPSIESYPNLENLKPSFGDSQERMFWRSKQCLDFAIMMAYGQYRGEYYIQIEDDVVTVPHYITSINNFVDKWNKRDKNWWQLQFSFLGFIGKLFPSRKLPKLIKLFTRKYAELPVDWLLSSASQIFRSKVHSHFPSLFQHKGLYSSLRGKKQKLKDKGFIGKAEEKA